MKELGIKTNLQFKKLPIKSHSKVEKSKDQFKLPSFLDSFKTRNLFKQPIDRKTFKQVVETQKQKFYQNKETGKNKKFNILRKLKINEE